jgi:hypothetical protein
MKTLTFFVTALLLAVIRVFHVASYVVVFSLLSPIILAIAFIGLNR